MGTEGETEGAADVLVPLKRPDHIASNSAGEILSFKTWYLVQKKSLSVKHRTVKTYCVLFLFLFSFMKAIWQCKSQ